MNGSRRIISICVAGALAVLILWWAAATVYFGPRNDLAEKIATVRGRVETYRDALSKETDIEAALRDAADRTLGENVETVDHRLRTRLNRLAEAVGITGAVVNTGNASARQTPARSAFRGRWRALRDRVDFVELDGSVSGEMTFAQVLELVDRIQAEPWMKHINTVRVEPKGGGDRYATSVRLTTIFIPDRSPRTTEAPEYDSRRLDRYAQLVVANPFQLPAPEVVAPPEVVAVTAPPAAPKFPWNQWFLTGIADGPDGPEVWLRNQKSGETRQLVVGGALHEARLLAIGSADAEFEIDTRRFRLEVGRNFGAGVRE